MRILIVPKIIKRYENQLEYSIEFNLIKFLKKIFKNSKLEILKDKSIAGKYSLIVISGGNNITKFSKNDEDKIRSKLDMAAYKFAKKYRVRILGICHGAQFLASKKNTIFSKDKKHIGTKHKIILRLGKKIQVNSYHKIKIEKLNQNFKILAKAEDDSIEAFEDENKNIGIIWHPERDRMSKTHYAFIKKILCN